MKFKIAQILDKHGHDRVTALGTPLLHKICHNYRKSCSKNDSNMQGYFSSERLVFTAWTSKPYRVCLPDRILKPRGSIGHILDSFVSEHLTQIHLLALKLKFAVVDPCV